MADVAEIAEAQTLPSVEEVAERIPPEIEAYEIVDGQVILTVGALDGHQHVITELGADLTFWARANGAIVRHQPFDLPTTRTRLRQPDLLVVLSEHRDYVTRRGMVGPPDLVVEVLSRSTRRFDLGDKRAEYAGLGVGEYWCFDADLGEAYVAAPPDAEWRTVRRGETLTSAVLPGFSVALDAVLPPAAS